MSKENAIFRNYQPRDADAVLRLNAESVAVLSPMHATRFRELSSMAALHLIAEIEAGVVGFLMTFTDGCDHDSVNYQFYTSRFKRFLYIDRVAIRANCRKSGIGRSFYERAEKYASENNLAWLVCEVNVDPPNAISLDFHDRLGFVEIAQQVVGPKRVSLRAKCIA